MNRKDVDLHKDLFLIPFCYDGESDKLEAPDHFIHYTSTSVTMVENGSDVYLLGQVPEGYTPATVADQRKMHYQTIMSQDGKRYIPLFISFESMFKIYSENIHVAVISFFEAKEFAKEVDGIAFAPLHLNKILKNDLLDQMH